MTRALVAGLSSGALVVLSLGLALRLLGVEVATPRGRQVTGRVVLVSGAWVATVMVAVCAAASLTE